MGLNTLHSTSQRSRFLRCAALPNDWPFWSTTHVSECGSEAPRYQFPAWSLDTGVIPASYPCLEDWPTEFFCIQQSALLETRTLVRWYGFVIGSCGYKGSKYCSKKPTILVAVFFSVMIAVIAIEAPKKKAFWC